MCKVGLSKLNNLLLCCTTKWNGIVSNCLIQRKLLCLYYSLNRLNANANALHFLEMFLFKLIKDRHHYQKITTN